MEAANPNWDESSCPGAVWDLLFSKTEEKDNDSNIFHDDTRFCWIPPGRWKRSTPPLTVARLMLSSQSVTLSEQFYCLKHQKMVTVTTLKHQKMVNVTTLRAWKTFQTELSAGSDGRADFVERKACNWITDTFQVAFVVQLIVVVVCGCKWITDTFQVAHVQLVVVLSSCHTFQYLFLGLFGCGLDRKLVVL